MSKELDEAMADYKEKRKLAERAQRASYEAQMKIERIKQEESKAKYQTDKQEKQS